MHGIIALQSLEQQWKDGEPVEVRFGQKWCPATVVGVGKISIKCKLLKTIKVVLGPKGFLRFRPNIVVFEEGEIVSRRANGSNVRKP